MESFLELFSVIGLITGVACVALLIRENIWTFPIGLVYSAVTIVVLYHQQLYINLLENGYYLIMNGYGWYYWRKARQPDAAWATTANAPVAVRRLGAGEGVGLLLAILITGTATGALFARYTDASVPYWDSFTTAICFAAMWLAARKVLENWWLWLIADVLYVGLYSYKDLLPYAALYGLYIVMAVWGYLAWRRSFEATEATCMSV